MAVGEIGHQGLGVDVGRHDDHAVDAPSHRAHRRFDFGFVVVGAGDDEVVAAAPGGDVDAANDLREELAVEIGEEDANRGRLAGDEASRSAVGDVAKCVGDIADAASGFFCHRPPAVEHPRDRCDGNAGFSGYIPDRNHRPHGRG